MTKVKGEGKAEREARLRIEAWGFKVQTPKLARTVEARINLWLTPIQTRGTK